MSRPDVVPPGRGGRRWIGIGAGLLLTPLAAVAAMAEEPSLEAFVRERLLYDDNIGLNTSGEVSDLSSRTTVGLDLVGGTEAVDVALSSRFDFTYYADEDDLDSADQSLSGTAGYRTPRSRLALEASYDRDTTRTSEVDDTGLFILDNIRREALELRPSWSLQATRLDRFTLSGRYREVDYVRSLVDHRRLGAALDWTRAVTRSSALTLAATAARVESDTTDNRRSDLFGGGLTLETAVDPRLALRVGVGVQWAETATDAAASQRSTEFLPALGLTFRPAPEAAIDLDYRRTLAASGSGNLVARDTVDLAYEQRWTRTLSFGLDARYRAQDRVFGDGATGRDFVRAEPWIGWRFTEFWSLGARYRYRWQSLDGDPEDAVSNAGIVTLTFRPAGWSLGG